MRGAPQMGLLTAMARTNLRISKHTRGRPGLLGLGQPPPVAFESLTLPSDDRFRLNEFERRSPTVPDLLQRDPKQSISIVQSWSLLVTCVDGQLMTKREVFQGDWFVTTEKEDEEANRQQQ